MKKKRSAGQPLTAEQRALLSKPINVLQLSVRVVNALENPTGRANSLGRVIQVHTVGELLTLRPEEIVAIPNLGQKTLEDIYGSLRSFGFLPGNRFVEPAKPAPTQAALNRSRAKKLLNFQPLVPEDELAELERERDSEITPRS